MARIKTDSTELVTDKSLQQIANGIIFVCALLMVWTLGCYIPVFRKMWKETAV